jgi:hypothetical protein
MATIKSGYQVDPNDERLLDAKAEGEAILTDYEANMENAITANDKAKDSALAEIGVDANGNVTKGSATEALINAQNAQTEFAIEKIEQQKGQAKADYIKEQSGAYKDWQKQSNPYGVNAEQMAAQGMQNTGFSESSQVAKYNQYQARVTAARESYVKIIQDYDNGMTQARLQNNSALAQIVADAMEKRLEIVTQFAMKNQELLTTKAQQVASIKQQNYQNYMSVYNQLMEENKLAEEIRQYNETMAFQREQFNWQKAQAAKASSGGSSSGSSGRSSSQNTAKSGGRGSSKSTKVSGAKKLAQYIASKANKKNNKNNTPTPDMASVLALGYGPISASRLNSLISQGLVEEYVDNGKLKYRRSGIAKKGGTYLR